MLTQQVGDLGRRLVSSVERVEDGEVGALMCVVLCCVVCSLPCRVHRSGLIIRLRLRLSLLCRIRIAGSGRSYQAGRGGAANLPTLIELTYDSTYASSMLAPC